MLMDEASLRPPIGDVLAVVGAVVTAHLNEGAPDRPVAGHGRRAREPAGRRRPGGRHRPQPAQGPPGRRRRGRRDPPPRRDQARRRRGGVPPRPDRPPRPRRPDRARHARRVVGRLRPALGGAASASAACGATPQVPAFVLPDALLGKHFAILGSTGSGKSCAVTVVLRAHARPSTRWRTSLVHRPARRVRGGAFGERALRPRTRPVSSCPTGCSPSRRSASLLASGDASRAYAEAAILRDAILRAKSSISAPQPTAPTSPSTRRSPTASPTSPGDRGGDGHAEQGRGRPRLPPPRWPASTACARTAATASCSSRSIVRDNLDARSSAACCGCRSPASRSTVLDISGVPSEVVNVVVSLLCRLIFEFALVVGPRRRSPPLLLVCEEAHRYVPADAAPASSPPAAPSTASPRRAASTASPCASSASGRPSSPPAACRSAARSSRCASATSATSSSSATPCPTASTG